MPPWNHRYYLTLNYELTCHTQNTLNCSATKLNKKSLVTQSSFYNFLIDVAGLKFESYDIESFEQVTRLLGLNLWPQALFAAHGIVRYLLSKNLGSLRSFEWYVTPMKCFRFWRKVEKKKKIENLILKIFPSELNPHVKTNCSFSLILICDFTWLFSRHNYYSTF